MKSLALALIVMMTAPMTGGELDEYQAKAMFLLSLTKFVDWGPEVNSKGLTMCIVGEDPFDDNIDELAISRSSAERQIRIRRLKDSSEIGNCQIAFVRYHERKNTAKALAAAQGKSVLTVGEEREFLRMGGIVGFSMNEDHLGILINAEKAQESGVKISAKLMSLAKIYKAD